MFRFVQVSRDLAPAGEGMHQLASLLLVGLVRLDERDGDVHARL